MRKSGDMAYTRTLDENPIIGDMQLRSARLRDLYRVWRQLCGTDPVLPRERLDPLNLPTRLLPHLALVEAVDDGAAFRYRLVGTGVTEVLGRDFTGDTVTAFSQRHHDAGIADGYRYVRTTGLPHRHAGDLRNEGREHVTYERLALPVSHDGGRTIATILAGFHFNAPDRDDGRARTRTPSGFTNTMMREK